MSSYKKISRDLLQHSVFSGFFLGLAFCLVIFFFSIELRVYEMENNQTIDYIQKQISSLGVIFWWSIFCIFPIFSTWFYRRKVSFLDYRSAFSVSCLTLLIGTLLYAIVSDFYEITPFSLKRYIFSLPIPMAYSFLLATLLKKQN